jgi:CspA family cold shock protein
LKEDDMPSGTVKWFNPDKGYGFIEPDQGGGDVFVHITAVQQAGMDNLTEGQKVTYELETGRNGKTSAVDLRA